MLGNEIGPSLVAKGSGAAIGALGVGIDTRPSRAPDLAPGPDAGPSRSRSRDIEIADGGFAPRDASTLGAFAAGFEFGSPGVEGRGARIDGKPDGAAGSGAEADGSIVPAAEGNDAPNAAEGNDAPNAGVGNAAPDGAGNPAPNAGEGNAAPAGVGSATLLAEAGSAGPNGSSRSELLFAAGKKSESLVAGDGSSSSEKRLPPVFAAGNAAPPTGAGNAAPPDSAGSVVLLPSEGSAAPPEIDGRSSLVAAGLGRAIVALPSGNTKIDDPHFGHRARIPALGILRSSVSKLT